MADPARMFDPLGKAVGQAGEDWTPIVPVPEDAQMGFPPHPNGKPSMSWVYLDHQGRTLMAVARFDSAGGDKEYRPLTYWAGPGGRKEWRWKALPGSRPLYGLDRLAARPDAPVLVVEGEKAADAAQSLFPDHVVITSPNGAKAARKADWSPLAGRSVVIWPDNDEEGTGYAENVARAAHESKAVSVSVVQPTGFPPGWDLADPLPDDCGPSDKLRHLLWGARPAVLPQQAGLVLRWAGQVEARLDNADFVEDFLGDGQLSVLYGESNTGKTFIACDLGLHVATGKEWFGKAVEAGCVVYAALEGSFGIRNRITAFVRHHGLDGGPPISFATVEDALDLLDPKADTAALIAAIKQAEAEAGKPVRLVIIDTLSRALAGGNENASEDMGVLVANADRIRKDTGAHVMFIHHSGKDATRGARGHSLLRAAVDTEIEVSRDQQAGISTLKVRKQRDLPLGGKLAFRLHPLELGVNRRGKPVTSCVVESVEGAATNRRVQLSPKEKQAMLQLQNALSDHGEMFRHRGDLPRRPSVEVAIWREYLKRGSVTEGDKPSSERQQFKRLKNRLVEKEAIQIWDDRVWLVQDDVTVT